MHRKTGVCVGVCVCVCAVDRTEFKAYMCVRASGKRGKIKIGRVPRAVLKYKMISRWLCALSCRGLSKWARTRRSWLDGYKKTQGKRSSDKVRRIRGEHSYSASTQAAPYHRWHHPPGQQGTMSVAVACETPTPGCELSWLSGREMAEESGVCV